MNKFFCLCLMAAIAVIMPSCQKDQAFQLPVSKSVKASERGTVHYGVTLFAAGNPSYLVTMDDLGSVVAATHCFIINGLGQQVPVDDLKGVCFQDGKLLVTTGGHDTDLYSDMLAEVVDPATGELSYISNSSVGTVSDIDYDAVSGNIYGLANNGNQLVSILNNNNNFDQYQVVGNINSLGNKYVAKGLTLAGPLNDPELYVAATNAAGGDARFYNLPFTAGAATLLTVVAPANQLATGHCALGYDVNANIMLINRRVAAGLGINSFGFNLPLGNTTNSAFWGGDTYNFEDLTTTR